MAGPVGGLVWVIPNDRTELANGVNPAFETAKQATLDCPPEFNTHAALFLEENATATGNSPIVLTGFPTMVNWVGS